MAMPDIPMYVFTGFLESGKTKFIQETLEDSRFHKGERTLLLLCEDGVITAVADEGTDLDGYEVIDLGRDVEYQAVVDAAKIDGVKLVGLSALMTTTLKSMADTIELVKKERPDCKIVVGGAVLTPEYAEKIGADYYARDAKATVDAAKEVYGN